MIVEIFNSLSVVVTLIAAGAIAAVCGLGFIVWRAGGRTDTHAK